MRGRKSIAAKRPWLAAMAIAVAVACPIGLAGAAEIKSIGVTKEQGRYIVTSLSVVQAPPEAVFEFLTDYDNFHKISSVFVESRFIERDPSGPGGLVYTLTRGCVAFLCKSIERVERLSGEYPHRVHASVLADRSSGARYGEASWQLTPVEGGTRIDYLLEMEPDFWIPPVLGPWAVKRSLKRGAEGAVERLEILSREIAARARGHDGSGDD